MYLQAFAYGDRSARTWKCNICWRLFNQEFTIHPLVQNFMYTHWAGKSDCERIICGTSKGTSLPPNASQLIYQMTKERANIAYVMGHQLLQCTIRGAKNGKCKKKVHAKRKKWNPMPSEPQITLHSAQSIKIYEIKTNIRLRQNLGSNNDLHIVAVQICANVFPGQLHFVLLDWKNKTFFLTKNFFVLLLKWSRWTNRFAQLIYMEVESIQWNYFFPSHFRFYSKKDLIAITRERRAFVSVIIFHTKNCNHRF